MNRNHLISIVVALVILTAIVISAMSPLLEWRRPVYIVAGFSGVLGLCVLLLQPLLAGGLLKGISPLQRSRYHRWAGSSLVILIVIHLVGLWITSPPDVIDALLYVSATPFSIWGVTAMWSIFITGLLVGFRRKLGLSVRSFRISHRGLALVTVLGSVVHALLIDGTMGTISKGVLCASVLLVTAWVLLRPSKR